MGLLECERVGSVGYQRGEQVMDQVASYTVHPLPHSVGGLVRHGG